MTDVVFELYRTDGVLQIDLASSLPKTLGRIDTNLYNNGMQRVVGSVNIPQWASGRPWFAVEGVMRNSIQNSLKVSISGSTLNFDMLVGLVRGPYIKYGVY